MSTKLFPINAIIDKGNVALGEFIGLNIGPNLVATDQGEAEGGSQRHAGRGGPRSGWNRRGA
jgi:hypothetical protein